MTEMYMIKSISLKEEQVLLEVKQEFLVYSSHPSATQRPDLSQPTQPARSGLPAPRESTPGAVAPATGNGASEVC